MCGHIWHPQIICKTKGMPLGRLPSTLNNPKGSSFFGTLIVAYTKYCLKLYY